MFISKGGYGKGEPKNVNLVLVQIAYKLVYTSLQTARFHAAPYRADNENLRKFVATYHRGIVFPSKQCSYQKEAMGKESLKM